MSGVCLFRFYLFGLLWAFWTWIFVIFLRLGKFQPLLLWISFLPLFLFSFCYPYNVYILVYWMFLISPLNFLYIFSFFSFCSSDWMDSTALSLSSLIFSYALCSLLFNFIELFSSLIIIGQLWYLFDTFLYFLYFVEILCLWISVLTSVIIFMTIILNSHLNHFFFISLRSISGDLPYSFVWSIWGLSGNKPSHKYFCFFITCMDTFWMPSYFFVSSFSLTLYFGFHALDKGATSLSFDRMVSHRRWTFLISLNPFLVIFKIVVVV